MLYTRIAMRFKESFEKHGFLTVTPAERGAHQHHDKA